MDNTVNITGDGIHFKAKDPIKVKTTFSSQPSIWPGSGWHYHLGPNFVSVTQGTLTFWDAQCHQFTVGAGHGYIEATGEVLMAKSPDSTTNAEWFTTRIYPAAAADDLVGVAAPCTP